MGKELYNKILAVQLALPKIDKDGVNPHFKSKYTTLPNVLSILLPILNSNGLIVSNRMIDGFVEVQIIDCDTEQKISTQIPIIGGTDMQKVGSIFTYAQRYGILSLLGLAADLDDDANAASVKQEVAPPPLALMTNQERRQLVELSSNMPAAHKEFVDKVLLEKGTTSEKAQAIINKIKGVK